MTGISQNVSVLIFGSNSFSGWLREKKQFSNLKDKKHTFSKVKGPKTYFLKLMDKNMSSTKVKGPKIYFSQKIYVL